MRIFKFFFIVFFFTGITWCQNESEPVKIKIRKIAFKAGNQYSVNIPDLEFHVLLQKSFDVITSTVSADYDYIRKDMGFGMSHAMNKYVVNPGLSVDDNLYFRKVFTDSTGIWSRKQSMTPFLYHDINDNARLVMNFKFEREWSPKRREGADIVTFNDYSLKISYLFDDGNYDDESNLNARLFMISVERSYKILDGQYNYLLLETLLHISQELNSYIRYRCNLSYQGNMTPQTSPIFFIGGHSSLIGYEKDEFWGREVFYAQNLLEFKPFPLFTYSIGNTEFRRLSFITQIDFGRVRGASHLPDLKIQESDLKIGLGGGFGFNTDIPIIGSTDIYLILASPADDIGDLKFYAGFGGWLQ